MDDIGGLLDGALAAEARETELVKKRGGIEIAEEKRADLIKLFNRIRATKDIDLILQGEKQCLKFELRKKANSDEMTASLEQAVKEIDVAIGTLDQVRHPEFYRAICKTQFELPKNQTRGGLPRAAARQFFRSHATRLKNLVASGIEASEKTSSEPGWTTTEKRKRFTFRCSLKCWSRARNLRTSRNWSDSRPAGLCCRQQ